ncbi:MAG TPA: hypothetical protein VJ521_05910 [Acidobacteriota bacterium]|nr:hypothetical protein [Acidobacteriota bacterium]
MHSRIALLKNDLLCITESVDSGNETLFQILVSQEFSIIRVRQESPNSHELDFRRNHPANKHRSAVTVLINAIIHKTVFDSI